MENIGTSPFSNSRCIVIHHFLIGDTASHVSFPGRFLQILGTCLVIWVRRTSGMWTTMAGDVCQKWRSQRVIRFLKDGHETNHAFGVPFSYCRTMNTIQVIHEISIFVFLRFHEKKWELLSWCFADRMLGFPWAMKETPGCFRGISGMKSITQSCRDYFIHLINHEHKDPVSKTTRIFFHENLTPLLTTHGFPCVSPENRLGFSLTSGYMCVMWWLGWRRWSTAGPPAIRWDTSAPSVW